MFQVTRPPERTSPPPYPFCRLMTPSSASELQDLSNDHSLPWLSYAPDLFHVLQSTDRRLPIPPHAKCCERRIWCSFLYFQCPHKAWLPGSTHDLLLERGEWGGEKEAMSLQQLGAQFQHAMPTVILRTYCSHTRGSSPPLNPNEEPFSPGMISIQCWKLEEKAISSLVLGSKVHVFK